jgi:predicted component of type VI protein secretion system
LTTLSASLAQEFTKNTKKATIHSPNNNLNLFIIKILKGLLNKKNHFLTTHKKYSQALRSIKISPVSNIHQNVTILLSF